MTLRHSIAPRIAVLALLYALQPAALAAQTLQPILYGTRTGLFRAASSGPSQRLWGPGEVKRILRTAQGWYFLTSEGIIHSSDLVSFETRNRGLPTKTLKTFRGDVVAYETEVQDIKDIEADPEDPRLMVVCTKDDVYLSRDAGTTWARFPSPVPDISGLKAVAVYRDPALTILASHPIKGLFRLRPDSAAPAWASFNAGLETGSGSSFPDELADIKIAPARGGGRASGIAAVPWVSGSFRRHVYAWDMTHGAFTRVLADNAPFGMAESLCPVPGGMGLVTDVGIGLLVLTSAPLSSVAPWAEADQVLGRLRREAGKELESAWFEGSDGTWISLNELWLLDRSFSGPRAVQAAGRVGIYLPTGFINTKLDDYAALLAEKGLNMLTVDLKDDFGKLRYQPRSEFVKSIGKVSAPIDLEYFTRSMKARGIYLVARIVVFKDKVAYENGQGRYAVWDAKAKQPWRGYFTRQREVEAASPAPLPTPPSAAGQIRGPSPSAQPRTRTESYRDYMEEYWVDPYCEWIWKYNVEIAREVLEGGFDEVQFDYIRFPTDGENLTDASYRFKGPGMDRESALMSFLAYARETIDAPISADIYGANGWYRTGVRTGQDVELLQRYVDAVCPMFYPSHFEQDFLAHAPAEERPYRIYYLGSMRNTYIGRYRLVVRPYVQAFKMGVKYDKAFYGLDYVLREVAGVRDSAGSGMTFWNSAGRYDDVPAMGAALSGSVLD